MDLPEARPGRFRWRVPLLWVGLFICCAGFAVAFHAVERQRREHVRLDAEIRATESALIQFLNNDFYVPPEEFLAAKHVENPQSVMRPEGDGSRIRIEGEAFGPQYAGWSVRLLLLDRKVVGGLQVRPPPVRVYRGPSNTWRRMEDARLGATIGAAAVWVVAMCIFPIARHWRPYFAQVALAAVVIAAAGWLADPSRTWEPKELRNPIPIALGAVGYLTLFAYALPVPKPKPLGGVSPCADCGYDLTGNVSGVCPECGLVTPQGMIDRWDDRADAFSSIELNEPTTEPVLVAMEGEASPDEADTGEQDSESPNADLLLVDQRVCV